MSTFRIPTPLRKFTGGKAEVAVDARSVAEALQQLGEQHPELRSRLLTEAGELRSFVNVFVGGRDVRAGQGLATALGPQDVVTILPAVAGGSPPAPAGPSATVESGGSAR